MSKASETKAALPDDMAPPAAKKPRTDEDSSQWARAVRTRVRQDPHFFSHFLAPDTQRHWVQLPQRDGAETTKYVCSLDASGTDRMMTFPGAINWDPRIFWGGDAPPDCNMLEPNQHGASDYLEVSVNLERSEPVAGWPEFADDQAAFRQHANDMCVLVAKELLVPLARKMQADADKEPKAKKKAVYGRVAGLSVAQAQALCAVVGKHEDDDAAALAVARPEPGQCTFFNGLAIKRDGGGVVYCKKNVYRGRKSEKYPWEEGEMSGRQLFDIGQSAHDGVVKWPFKAGEALCRKDNVIAQVAIRVCFSKTGVSLRYEPSQVMRLHKAGAHSGGSGAFNLCSIDYDAVDAQEAAVPEV